MAKFGKLELTDDSDEDTDKVIVVSARKRAVGTTIIRSDEEDEDSLDLSSLSPSPAPVRRKLLEDDTDSSKVDNAAERVKATGEFFGSIGKSLLGGTRNRNDEPVMVLEGPPSVQKKTDADDRQEEDSDNDSVYEIPPADQTRNIQAAVASMKTIPYNKPSRNSLTQSRTILAASTSPTNRIVYTPSAPSSSRTHAPEPHETSSPVNLKLPLPPKLAPRRSQKQSSDITSWNQSKRVQPAPIRPLLLSKPAGGLPKSSNTATASVPQKPARTPLSPTATSSFTSKSLLASLSRPSVPSLSSSLNGGLVTVASNAAFANLAPSLGPAEPAEIETGIDIAAPIPVIKSEEDVDMVTTIVPDIFGSSGDEDAASPTSPTEDSQISAESSTPEQHTYVLTSEYDRQLYKAVRSHWAPLAQMREQLANARLAADMDEESDGVSSSEGNADLTAKSGRWYGGLARGWKPGDTGVLRMEITGGNGNLKTQPERTHTTEENVSVALAMRRYTERLWSAASNLPGVLVGAPLAEDEVQASGLEEKEEDAAMMPLPEAPRLLENRREVSGDLPARSSDVEITQHTQFVTRSLSGDPSATPVPLDTPTTEPSTAATLVDLSTTPKDPIPPPAITLTPHESNPWVLRPSSPVQTPTQSAITYHASDSGQTTPSYDFSYESTAMHIGSASWDANSFAIVRTIAPNSKSVIQPASPIQIEAPNLPTRHEPPSPHVTSYRPTRHFLGVEPPSIPGTKRYALDAVLGPLEGDEAVEVEESFSEVEDLSESELTPEALGLYQAFLFQQELFKEEQEQAKETHKRKTLDSESSAPEEEPEYEDYARPKKKVQRGSRKRRKLSQTIPPIDSDSPLHTLISRSAPTARRLRLRAAGMTLQVPLGLGVDDIDPYSVNVRQVRGGIVGTTALCHQCRCHNTNEQRKAQCGNVTIHASSSTSDTPGSARCNKTFCERCLRGWYGFDDDAITFVKGGQRMMEGRGTGTGIGIGIVEGIWICPFCINLCMCTICSRKRDVERTKYAPSANAGIAAVTSEAILSRPRPTSETGTRITQSAVDTTECYPQPLSTTHPHVIRLPRRIDPPPVPTQWLPAIPTPTPGLDPIFYEATRPCTRDFPTGAPQPTAANHAPILYHVGADLENDGVEDSFTGSEMSEDEEGGENRVCDDSARVGSNGEIQRDAEVAASRLVVQTTRKNFLIVTPGRRMPSTMKKRHDHPKGLFSPSLSTPDTPQEPDQVLDDIACVSLESPTKFYTNKEPAILDHYPATVDPMHLFGSGSGSRAEESPTQSPSTMIDVQADLNIISKQTDSPHSEDASLDPGEVTVYPSSGDDDNGSAHAYFTPHFDDYEMLSNEEVQIGSPTLAMGDYNDFLPIMGGNDDVTEGIDFLVDTHGDVLMDDGLFSLLLPHPSPQQDPDLLALDPLGFHD